MQQIALERGLVSPLRSRRSSARLSYEEIENALSDVEIILPKKIETEDFESDCYHRKKVEYEKEHETRKESEEDSAEEEERSRRTASSASVELDRRYCIVLLYILHSAFCILHSAFCILIPEYLLSLIFVISYCCTYILQ
jgi:hypothetical protein